jgi:type II secretory pathway predicted ATPase ExeA
MLMDNKLLSLFGLKWNPFTPDLPSQGLYAPPAVDNFCWRVEQLVREGGFALITGEPGTGKSVALRLLAERLDKLREVSVGGLQHPQSRVTDFYRELGDLFGIPLVAHNRWGGFKALREKWHAHIETTLTRPVLLIDEAQEMLSSALSELRLLASAHFDSRTILTVVLCGDTRLPEKFRTPDLLPLGSRIRTRLTMEYANRDALRACLEHVLQAAGNPTLMTTQLITTLCEHSAGNHRVLMTMAGELLVAAAKRELPQLDEKLYFDLFGQQSDGRDRPPRPTRPAGR